MGHLMGCLNSHEVRGVNATSAYATVFGVSYHEKLECHIEEMKGCRSLRQRLRLNPDARLEESSKEEFDLEMDDSEPLVPPVVDYWEDVQWENLIQVKKECVHSSLVDTQQREPLTAIQMSSLQTETNAMNPPPMHPVAEHGEAVTPAKAVTSVQLVSIKEPAVHPPVKKQRETNTRKRLDDSGCTFPTLKCGKCTHKNQQVALCIGDNVYNCGLREPEPWRLLLRVDGKDTWTVKSDRLVRQKDSDNCGPIACLKIWKVFCPEEVDMASLTVNDYRNAMVDKCNVLIEKNKSQFLTKPELDSINKRKRMQLENAACDAAIDITGAEVCLVTCDEDARNAARIVASGKRKLFQLKQAEMMMKRREQCLKHVTVGTLVSCKMDPRDVKNALGLLAIILEVSESGAGGIQVVTTHGLITTENGKGPYWLPSDRFERLRTDVMNANIPFYTTTRTISGKSVASLEARLLLPLKAYAYGVPPHCFADYFQMSFNFTSECCKHFDLTIFTVYKEEYLRLPTAEDLKSIVALHKAKHKVDGMLGSLDCTHTYWHKCPVAWKGQYQGRNSAPSLVLEAACDHNLYFWHLSYGHCGCLNDLNILNRSPLYNYMLEGQLYQLEQEANIVPFMIGNESFEKAFYLVDGIYPRYTRFVKSFKFPASPEEKAYAGWQEGARKDIERAFGVLKTQWQFLARPIQLHTPNLIAMRASACFILHNMLQSDRVMKDVHATYRAAEGIDLAPLTPEDVGQPTDLRTIQLPHDATTHNEIVELNTRAEIAQWVMSRGEAFRDLKDSAEFSRLHRALLDVFGRPNDDTPLVSGH
ncbi:plant transposon protein [Nitzschia inconspicua]|uniref:Plant transposon protein n=1 Tax=Nitzschia inconspicua TaxID=303405 RepID=A0A9K3LWY1_9STRA|nr:plant transposon protein [Nitzschia inconspicua]